MIDPQIVLAACVCASTAQVYAPGDISRSNSNISFVVETKKFSHSKHFSNPGLAIPAAAPSHQFHAQDEFGQFSFGHAGGPSARTEVSLTKLIQLGITQDPKQGAEQSKSLL